MENQMSSDRIGNYLRQYREKRSLSVEDIANETKINGSILYKLESNEFDGLPSKAYVRGFVINYCKMVEANSDVALTLLEKEYRDFLTKAEEHLEEVSKKISEDMHNHDSKAEANEPKPSEFISTLRSVVASFFTMVFKWKVPIAVAVVLISIIIGMTVFYQSVSVTQIPAKKVTEDIKPKEQSLFKLSTTEKMREELSSEKPAAAAPEKVNENKKEEPAPEKEEVKVTEEKKEPVDKSLFPKKNFYPITGTLFTLNRNAPELSDTDLYPTSFRSIVNLKISNVYIKADVDDTWLAYKIDQQPIRNLILKKGGELKLIGKTIRLYLGNINATKIFYNNALVVTNSKTGVKSLIFPESAKKNFKLPLFVNDANGVLHTSEDYIENMQ